MKNQPTMIQYNIPESHISSYVRMTDDRYTSVDGDVTRKGNKGDVRNEIALFFPTRDPTHKQMLLKEHKTKSSRPLTPSLGIVNENRMLRNYLRRTHVLLPWSPVANSIVIKSYSPCMAHRIYLEI